jgi:methylglyoxal synthase
VERNGKKKTIAVCAHDNRKLDLVDWARLNREVLVQHDLIATSTTGAFLQTELGVPVVRLNSGPLGGDQQIGARIAEGAVDLLVFFWDPLQPHPHEADVQALLRIALVWNVPVACNRATADFMISSPLLGGDYERVLPHYGDRHLDDGHTAGAQQVVRTLALDRPVELTAPGA